MHFTHFGNASIWQGASCGSIVLDASDLLAMFFGQSGMEREGDLFHKAADTDNPLLISAVNWAEVLYRRQRKRGKA